LTVSFLYVQTPLAAKKKSDAPVSFVTVPVVQRKRRGIVAAFTLCFLVLVILIVTVSGVCLFKFIVHKVSRSHSWIIQGGPEKVVDFLTHHIFETV